MITGPLLTVNAVSRTPVVAITVCRRITVQEDPSVAGWPTSDYFVAEPPGGNQHQKSAGIPFVFLKPDRTFFQPGDKAGDLELIVGGGSTSFSQLED